MTSALFIIDCGLTSGLGHVRRSLVLADAFRKRGVVCQFYITSDIALPMLRRFGFTDILDQDDLPTNLDLLVIDGNSFTKRQINKWVKAASMLCLIDDNGKRPMKADVLINPNLYAKSISYNKYECEHFLLGPECHLVASEFFSPDADKGIEYLISFGGTDDGRLAGPLIKRLQLKTDKNIVWAVPSHICPQAEIVALAGVKKNLSIETDGNIPELFARTRCFIGGAGTMVSEALASNCSVVTCAIVPDQDKNIELLKGLNLPAFRQFDVDLILEAAIKYGKYNKPAIKLKDGAAEKIAGKILGWMRD